ncbi:cell division protein FtsA [bacterium]|nr:cell division protein FtsA [bacterium]
MPKQEIVTGLDIGSSKICCMILKKSNFYWNIIGFSQAHSLCLSQGGVIDFEMLTSDIKNVVNEARETANVEVDNLIVNLSGSYLRSFNANGFVLVDNSSKKVKRHDLERALFDAQNIDLDSSEEIIQMIIKDFCLDNKIYLENPIGIVADKLQANVHIVAGNSNYVHNIFNCIENAGFGVSEVLISSCLSAEALLAQEEKELGAVLVDIGHTTTDIIVYVDKKVSFTCVLPFGGQIISEEIAKKLRIPMSKVEELKCRHGYVGDLMPGYEEEILLSDISGFGFNKIKSSDMQKVIQVKIDEILFKIKNVLEESGYINKISGGIIFTGGTSLTKGFIKYARVFLKYSCRLGNVSLKINNGQESIKGPQYSVIAGIKNIVAKGELEKFNYVPRVNKIILFKNNLRKFFAEIF